MKFEVFTVFVFLSCSLLPGLAFTHDKVTVIPLIETAKETIEPFCLVPDTGQTASYTDTFGEDSDYTINSPSYTDNGNGTVTDNVTSLVWQQTDDDTKRNWADAWDYCQDLSLGGKTDWHLPGANELMSIVNYGNSSPSIDSIAFPGTNSSHYWSANTSAINSEYAWYVVFNFGRVWWSSKSFYNYARCVRGKSVFNGIYRDNGNDTVTDFATGLIWQQKDDNVRREWNHAILYCEGLDHADWRDWRLPNIKELRTIVNMTASHPSADMIAFPGTNSYGQYWSSTTDPESSSTAWAVMFDVGGAFFGSRKHSKEYYVRCVRGGQ